MRVSAGMQGRRSRGNWLALLQGGLGFGLLVWLVSRYQLPGLSELGPAERRGLLLGTLLVLCSSAMEIYRIHVLARPGLARGEASRLTLISYLFANLLPTSVGGDAYRIFALQRSHGVRRATLFIIMDRSAGLLSLLLGFVVCLPLIQDSLLQWLHASDSHWRPSTLILANALVAVALALLLLLLFLRRRSVLRSAIDAPLFTDRGDAGRRLAALMAGCTAFHGVRAFGVVVMAAGFGAELGFAQSWVVLGAAGFAAMLPVTVAGLGVREGALVALLVPLGMDATDALVCALAIRGVNLLQAAAGGLTLLLSPRAFHPRAASAA